MKVKSTQFHPSNKIRRRGGTLRFIEDKFYSSSWDDKMSQGFSDLWTVTESNLSVTHDEQGASFSFAPSASSLSLDFSEQISWVSTYSEFLLDVKYEWAELDVNGLEDANIARIDLVDGSNQDFFAIVESPTTEVQSFKYSIAGVTGSQTIGVGTSIDLTLSIRLLGSRLSFGYYMQGEFYEVANEDPVLSNTLLSILSSSDGGGGIVTLANFRNQPVLSGYYDPRGTSRLVYMTDEQANFDVVCGTAGIKQAKIGSSGEYFGLTRDVEFEAVEGILEDPEVRVMVSDVVDFYSDELQSFVCPDIGKSVSEVRGDAEVILSCCFEDGSDQDGTETIMIANNSSKLDQYDLRRERRNEVIFEEEGLTRGSDFSFRFQKAKTALGLENNRTYCVSRSKVLSNYRECIYGLTKPNAEVSVTVLPVLEYVFSDAQIGDPNKQSDFFDWYLIDENGTVLQFAEGIGSDNYQDPANVPNPELLSEGSYTFKIRARSGINSAYSDPNETLAQISADIHYGSGLVSDPVVESGKAKVQIYNSAAVFESESTPAVTQYKTVDGVCHIDFEVKEYSASPYILIYANDGFEMLAAYTLDNDASALSNSVGLFEDAKGNVVIMTMRKGASEITDTYSYLEFSCYNQQTDPIGSGRFFIDLEDLKTVFCFDVVCVDNTLSIFLGTKYEENVNFQSPDGDSGVMVINYDISNVDFDQGFANIDIPETSRSYFSDDLNRLMAGVVSNSFSADDPDWPQSPTGLLDPNSNESLNAYKFLSIPKSVRVSLDEFGDVVVSCIERFSNLPSVLYGSISNPKCVSIPAHLDLNEVLTNLKIPQGSVDTSGLFRITDRRDLFKMDSLDASMHTDGMIYSIASLNGNFEIGVVDPYHAWSGSSSVEVSGDGLLGDAGLVSPLDSPIKRIVSPEYGFTCMDFNCSGLLTGRRSSASIQSSNGYLNVFTCANPTFYPNWFRNETLTDSPLEVPMGLSWSFPLKENMELVDIQGSVTSYETRISNQEYVKIDLGCFPLETKFHNYDACLDYGTRARAEFRKEAGATDSVEPVVLHLDARAYYGSAAIETDYIDSELRLYPNFASLYLGGVEVARDNSFVLLENVDYVLDLCVIPSGSSRARAVGLIRTQNKGSYENRDQTVVLFSGDESLGFQDRTDSKVEIRYGINSDSSDSFLSVDRLGVGKMSGPKGSQVYETILLPDLVSTYDLYSWTPNPSKQGEWRRYNDMRLASLSGDSELGRIVGFSNQDGRSRTFHLWNGFEVYFSGDTTLESERWSLQRLSDDIMGSLTSRRMASVWATDLELEGLTVYAKSSDSGLSRFYLNSVVVDGVNVPEIEVLSGSPSDWTVEATLQMEEFCGEVSSVFTVSEGKYRVGLSQTSFSKSDASEFDYYLRLRQDSGCPIHKVDRVSGEYVFVESNPNFSFDINSGDEVSIFCSRKTIEIPNVVESEFIGLRFKESQSLVSNTFEGYLRARCFDFGMARENPINPSYSSGSGLTYVFQNEEGFKISQQAKQFGEIDRIGKDHSFTYKLASSNQLLRLTAIVDEITLNRKSVWILKFDGDSRNAVQSLISSLNHQVLLDDDGDKYYECSIQFSSVED